jgi:UDP-2,3-diacylglucosamine pyrophosphatase LpxH
MISSTIEMPEDLTKWQKTYWTADWHFGGSGCREKELKRDLERAADEKCRIVGVGDIFDAILIKDVKRFKPSTQAKWLAQIDATTNETIDEFVKFVLPYAEFIDVLGMGNHELSVIKYHGIDLIRDAIKHLNLELKAKGSKHRIRHGSYIGFVKYFTRCAGKGNDVKYLDFFYWHGGGGNSPITKGLLDAARLKQRFVFDVAVIGHKHHHWADADKYMKMTSNGKIVSRERRITMCGTYSDEYDFGDNPNASHVSFSEQNAFQPPSLGGTWIKWKFYGQHYEHVDIRVEI